MILETSKMEEKNKQRQGGIFTLNFKNIRANVPFGPYRLRSPRQARLGSAVVREHIGVWILR